MIDQRTKTEEAVAALRVKEMLQLRGLKTEDLQDLTKLSDRTINGFLAGEKSSAKTKIEIATALGIDPRLLTHPYDLSDVKLGKYSRIDVAQYEGKYIFITPNTNDGRFISSHKLEMCWSEWRSCLVFGGLDTNKTMVVTEVSFPEEGYYFSFHLKEKGYTSLCIMSRMGPDSQMFGMMLTLGHKTRNEYKPMCMPVVMIKMPEPKNDKKQKGWDNEDWRKVGIINPGTESHKIYKDLLLKVFEEGYGEIIMWSENLTHSKR